MSSPDRAHAHRRALRTAAAITLGLVGAASGGCEQTVDALCRFSPYTQTCCERSAGWRWDETTQSCENVMPPYGPLVPPEARA